MAHRYPLHLLPVRALRGKSIFLQIGAVFRLLHCVFLSMRLIRKINPDVVLSMGGYASGPGSIAAWLLRKRLVIHEQNAVAGLTNRWLSRIATVTLSAFPAVFPQKRNAMVVGNPVRPTIAAVVRDHTHFKKPWRILVLGGSQGAQAINRLVSDWLSRCQDREDFIVWHQTGKKDFDRYRVSASVRYRVNDFIEKMDEALTWADLVIARAGALTVFEVAAAGVPALFIPFPSAVDDHQYKNALFLAKKNASLVYREAELSGPRLNDIVTRLFSTPDKLQSMSDNAKVALKNNATPEIIRACFPFNQPKTVFFSGIGGIGMSGLAELLHRQGATVLGSDVSCNSSVQHLKKMGITVFDSHDAAHIHDIDLFVYSSAIDKKNPERKAAEAQSIPMQLRGELLAEVMQADCNIAVAGTHGKTTTSGLIAWVLEKADCKPTFVIGGILRDRESPIQIGENRFFVAESDESDASFLFLSPTVAVFTNIDSDHMETYEHNFDRLKDSFLKFSRNIPANGFAVVCIDDPALRDIKNKMHCRVITYGESADADFQLLQFHQTELKSECVIRTPDQQQIVLPVNLPGKHNALNAMTAFIIATHYGIAAATACHALSTFPGMGRRFHFRGEMSVSQGSALLFDDYGHHPVELRVTLQAAKAAWPNRRVIMVFQPHRYTRTRDLLVDFVDVLKTADHVVLTEVYAASENKIEGADGLALFHAVKQAGQQHVDFVLQLSELETVLQQVVKPNDVVILQGAGNIVTMSENLLRVTTDAKTAV